MTHLVRFIFPYLPSSLLLFYQFRSCNLIFFFFTVVGGRKRVLSSRSRYSHTCDVTRFCLCFSAWRTTTTTTTTRMTIRAKSRTKWLGRCIPGTVSRHRRSVRFFVFSGRAPEDTCPWCGQRHPPTFERMHRDMARNRPRAREFARGEKYPSRSQTGFHVRETLLTVGRFHVHEEEHEQVRTQSRLRKGPRPFHRESQNVRDHDRCDENCINDQTIVWQSRPGK